MSQQFTPPVAAPAPVAGPTLPGGGGPPVHAAPKTTPVSFRPEAFIKTGFLDDIAVFIVSARWVNDFQYASPDGKVSQRLNRNTNMMEDIPHQLALKVVYRLDDGSTQDQFYTAGNRDRFDLINDGRGLMGGTRDTGLPDSTNVSFFIEKFVSAGLSAALLDGNDMALIDGYRVQLQQLPTPNRNFREVGPSAAGAGGPAQGQQQTQRTLPVPVFIFSAPGEAVVTPVPASVAPPMPTPVVPAPTPVVPVVTPNPGLPTTNPAPVTAPPVAPPPAPAPVTPADPQLIATLNADFTEFIAAQKASGVTQLPKGGFVTTLIGKHNPAQEGDLAGRLVQAADDAFYNGMVAAGTISAYDQVTLTF